MTKEIIAIDLFCGAGGLTRGLIDSGIRVLRGYDLDKNAKKTYESNNGSEFHARDISSLSGLEILSKKERKGKFFLLAGCAPCQPFSLINKKNLKKDNRRILLLQFARLIKESLPDFIFMENVPGLVNNKGKQIFQKFLKILNENKYFYDYRILNVMYYGVPQKRKRLVLIASKHSKVKIPAYTHGGIGEKKLVKLKNIFKKYPPLKAGEKDPSVSNHEARNLSPINIARLNKIKKNGGSRIELPLKMVLKCHLKHTGHSDVYGRMSMDDLSPTLTCKCTSISNGRFGHPTQNRAISIREAAAIQTFKDNYVFYGNMTQNTLWIGNAVPVKFARIFGEYFKSLVS